MKIEGVVERLEDTRFSATGEVTLFSRREIDGGCIDWTVKVYGPISEISKFRLGQNVTIDVRSAE